MQASETLAYKAHWICEQWEQDKVEYCQRVLKNQGITHIRGPLEVVELPLSRMERIAKFTLRVPIVPKTVIRPSIMPITHGISSEMLRKIVGDPDAVKEVAGNLLLNEGIQRLEDLVIAAGGTAYNNANSYVGVGDSNTAEAATQTELQAASNRFYKAMNATFPSRASQTLSFQSDFTTTEANYAWAEWSISAGATTASGAGFTTGTTNLNRKVSSLGTKTTGTWTLTSQVTVS